MSENAWLDYVTELIQPDGSYHHKTDGVTTTGFLNVELAVEMALLVELRAISEHLESIKLALWERV